MDQNLEKLHEVDTILAKLVDGHSLTAIESENLVYHIFLYDTEGLHYATWVGAMHAKGETSDELLGFLKANQRLAAKFDLGININKVTDLSGTGGGKFKTINVSTAASFVVATAGYTVAKEAYFGVTSPTGSADIFTAFGVNFFKLSAQQIKSALKEVGICPIFTPFISPKLANRSRLSKKFFLERQVRVRTPLHLVSNIYSPIPMNHRIYGCYSEKYLEILAGLFKKLGFKKTLTFHGEIGLPEIANVGKTIIVEQNRSGIKRYTIRPQDLGIKEAKEEDIRTGGRDQNVKDFVSILKGKEQGPKADLVAVNAGAALYALEDTKTIEQGTKKSKEILKSGLAYQKLEDLIRKIGSLSLLKNFQA